MTKHDPSQAPLPLAYAMRDRPAPIDWWRAGRQTIFAFGVAFVAAGITDVWGFPHAWYDNGVLWNAFGAGMIALVIPFPCGFGRKGAIRGTPGEGTQ